MVAETTECDSFQGRMRDICTGTAALPISKINAYRARWNLPPLPDTERYVPQQNPMAASTGGDIPRARTCGCNKRKRFTSQAAMTPDALPGVQLVKYYQSIGMPPCQACKDLAARMDEWGVAGCRERLADIVSDILPRAKAWVKGKAAWVGALFPTFEDAALKFKINRDVTSAIDTAEAAEKAFREAEAARTVKPATTCCGKKKRTIASSTRTALLARQLQERTADATPATSAVVAHRQSVCASCPLNRNGMCEASSVAISETIHRRADACLVGKWFPQNDSYRPLVNPTRNMLFHIYPLLGAEWNWQWHIDQIHRVAPLFNGRVAIGIAEGDGLARPEVVQAALNGVPVTDWVIRHNSKQLGETSTFVDLLSLVKTDDPNTITFRGHTKGVTHKRSGVEQHWARLMWATCMDLPSVDDALASHIMAGSMKCHEPLVARDRGNWFYAGTMFWAKSDVFTRNWSHSEPTRWWPEYWPGQVADEHEAACLCHDFTKSSVLNTAYWVDEALADFELWKSARPNRRIDLE